MKVLIGCEYSGIVREAFKAKGHDVWSCDLLDTEIPGQHIKGDVLKVLNNGWDMMLVFPPCQYLTVTANRVFKCNPERWQKRLDAVNFVWELMNANIGKMCIENPKGVLSSYIRKPDQYIQPYEYGYPGSKMTGFWLKNLPLLKPEMIVEPEWIYPKSGSGKRMSKIHAENSSTNNPENAKLRSRTYQGIANAMANQWG